MNNHLNLFQTYSKQDREYQLENDLTRAFGICLRENKLFLYTILNYIFEKKENHYNHIFDDFDGKSNISIDIQKKVTDFEGFDHLFAVSLSECQMDCSKFFNNRKDDQSNHITDLAITIHDTVIIFEVKANNTDCAFQLYNQATQACGHEEISEKNITAVDLNWKVLMELVVKVANFEKAIEKPSRVLKDFINFIQRHNYSWLPQAPLGSLKLKNNLNKALERIETAITHSKYRQLDNRLGFVAEVPWASEIILDLYENSEKLIISMYPGNTKGQGGHLFSTDNEPHFKQSITVNETDYEVKEVFHIKFTSFQSFFTGLDFTEENLQAKLYTYQNFKNHTGRNKREQHWSKVADLFDHHFKPEYNWKTKCDWEGKILNSGKNQFDMSFGYKLSVELPFKTLQEIDQNKDIKQLTSFLDKIKEQFEQLLKSKTQI